VVEIDGSTVDAAWHLLDDVLGGRVPVVQLVRSALEAHLPVKRQRLAAKALIRRGDRVLLARLSVHAVETGRWTLPAAASTTASRPRPRCCGRSRRRPAWSRVPARCSGSKTHT
jgi:hypothetical protein